MGRVSGSSAKKSWGEVGHPPIYRQPSKLLGLKLRLCRKESMAANPPSDMTSHSDHPFPSDIETMLREIDSLGDAPMRWNLARPDFGSSL
jgi:hypothetical protein